jgi:hypothetical protein
MTGIPKRGETPETLALVCNIRLLQIARLSQPQHR